jgi:hypothetical protein
MQNLAGDDDVLMLLCYRVCEIRDGTTETADGACACAAEVRSFVRTVHESGLT